MSKRARIFVSVLSLFVATLPQTAIAQRAVVIVRHAEKVDESLDPPLSDAGEKRAGTLANILRTANLSAIFCTEFRRTCQTAAPVAAELKIAAVPWSSKDVPGLVKQIRNHKNEVVLVVGHSSTVPPILKALGDPESVQIGNDFDNIFIVVPHRHEVPTVLRLHY